MRSMTAAAKLDTVVKTGWAAKVLGIDCADLPKLDHPWTKRDVRRLRDDRPQWLTEARRRHAKRVAAASRAKAERLAADLAELGYTAPDLGTLDQAVLYIDGARTHLVTATRCSERDADTAAWLRWPRSMACEEADVDESNGRY
jgi:hypothetical protein